MIHYAYHNLPCLSYVERVSHSLSHPLLLQQDLVRAIVFWHELFSICHVVSNHSYIPGYSHPGLIQSSVCMCEGSLCTPNKLTLVRYCSLRDMPHSFVLGTLPNMPRTHYKKMSVYRRNYRRKIFATNYRRNIPR